jgi:polysaccharide biosynthesis protein PslH
MPRKRATTRQDAPSAAEHTDVLLLSDAAPWPLDQGRRIRGHHMLAALNRLGVRARIAAIEPMPTNMPAPMRGLMLPWPTPRAEQHVMLDRAWRGPLGPLRRRLTHYLMPDVADLAGAAALVEQLRPRIVIALGQFGPLLLHAAASVAPSEAAPIRVWYAADELVYFHLSCLPREPWCDWPTRIRRLLEHLALERLFVRRLYGAVGVSPRDAALLHRIAGARRTICIRNGVDLDHFTPATDEQHEPAPFSLAFWGRMDFEPNIDAMTWFAANVWPRLRLRFPRATLTIAGKNPAANVLALADRRGITVTGEVDDIRPVAAAASVVILPMRCGGGIKNKLLEAAAMGKAVIASPHAVKGLDLPCHGWLMQQTLLTARTPDDWLNAVGRLWSDKPGRQRLGCAARQWVQQHHTWDAAARQLLDWLGAADLIRASKNAPDTDSTTDSRKAA